MPTPPLLRTNWSEVQDLMFGKTLALFLDFDGTLTPVHDRPELANLSESMRSRLQRLSAITEVAIVTGRDRDDVQEKIDLEDLIYVGCHGFDVGAPYLSLLPEFVHSVGTSELKKLSTDINELVGAVSGIIIKRKKWAIAIHYREVPNIEVNLLESSIMSLVASYTKFSARIGKKVIEITPNVDWNKGQAVTWLVNIFEEKEGSIMPIYVGDDVTDEDAFCSINGHGISIVVSSGDKESAAMYRVEDSEEVGWFLDRTLEVLMSR